MKIDEHVRAAYSQQNAVAARLKAAVDKEIEYHKLSAWHYESRIKGEESYALKVECGRPGDPKALEDFFACVVVVPNYLSIKQAEEMIVRLYGEPAYKRPDSHEVTKKEPSDFRFDDLRLYMRYRDQGYGPPSGLEGTLFEVQVRTFLQHAWNMATHDVIYKSDDVSWRRERVAHQAKAALEQAEVTIASMSDLENSAALPATHKRFQLTNAVIAILKDHWESDQLPADVRRLALGVTNLLAKLAITDEGAFKALLENGRSAYGGKHNLNWSPYRAIVQYLAEQHGDRFKRTLRKSTGEPIFVYPSVLGVLALDMASAPRAVLLTPRDIAKSSEDADQQNCLQSVRTTPTESALSD